MMNGLALLIAYFLGAVPFGYLLVKWRTGGDVRASGSGNIGATNVLRTTGRALGVVTLLLDIGKGFAAVWIAALLTAGSPVWTAAAALAVMAGHAYPVFLKFRGGKAVASFVGAFLYLAPAALGATLVVFVLLVARTRYISLGSIVGAAILPFAAWLISHAPAPTIAAAAVAGAFVIWRHKENIVRLRTGSENTLSLGRKPA
jgi:acyl phosphate:glycerol-3-phosphate acyltransferase